jgi:8-oxo-dGTP pyrophosphatase MutT (NUDIX family)
MPLDLAKFRSWARIPHTEDDPAIGIAWEAAVRELEERTGWVVDPVSRTQYVGVEPTNTEKLVLLSRQPATAATCVDDNSATINLTLVTINGLQYASLDEDDLSYPLILTVSCGSNTLNPLLEMALLQRVTQHVASRGDDTVTLSSDYWDRISSMMGKGIG